MTGYALYNMLGSIDIWTTVSKATIINALQLQQAIREYIYLSKYLE